MSNDILKAFSIEALRFKDKPKKVNVEYQDEVIRVWVKLTFNSPSGTASVLEMW